jgi:hypothetical protein
VNTHKTAEINFRKRLIFAIFHDENLAYIRRNNKIYFLNPGQIRTNRSAIHGCFMPSFFCKSGLENFSVPDDFVPTAE